MSGLVALRRMPAWGSPVVTGTALATAVSTVGVLPAYLAGALAPQIRAEFGIGPAAVGLPGQRVGHPPDRRTTARRVGCDQQRGQHDQPGEPGHHAQHAVTRLAGLAQHAHGVAQRALVAGGEGGDAEQHVESHERLASGTEPRVSGGPFFGV